MKERPILMSGAMVRACLEGSKTQTRRIFKKQPPAMIKHGYTPKVYWPARDIHMSTHPSQPAYMQFEAPGEYDGRNVMGPDGWGFKCPYGQPGDRLWVRESHFYTHFSADELQMRSLVIYKADGDFDPRKEAYGRPWRPSIHMPRWACRLMLEITDVRAERLQDISEADAIAEGAADYQEGFDPPPPEENCTWSYRTSYSRLWDSLNAKRAPWASNPWVWVVEFKRVMP